MGLEDIIRNAFGGGNGTSRSYGRRDYVRVQDGDDPYDTEAEVLALITGAAHEDAYKIWQLTVPAQQRIAWGYGSAGLPYNQGYMWFASMQATVDWDDGRLRLVQARSRDRNGIIVAEFPDNSLHTSTVTSLATARPTNIQEMRPLPEKTEYPLVGEDSILTLWYALYVASAGHDHVGFDIPVTVYE